MHPPRRDPVALTYLSLKQSHPPSLVPPSPIEGLAWPIRVRSLHQTPNLGFGKDPRRRSERDLDVRNMLGVRHPLSSH